MFLQCEQPDLQEFFKSLKGYPHEHVEVFSKFGRFPGRNAAAGRPSTAQELEWLSSPDCPAWCKSQTASATSSNPQSTSLLTYPHVLQAVSHVYANQVSASEIVARAVAAAEDGLYCEAEQLFLRALSLEDSPSSREMCAQVAMENDCPAVAVEHASHAAALQPTWPLAFITLGRACRNAGMRSGFQFRVLSSTIIFAAIHFFSFRESQTCIHCVHYRIVAARCKRCEGPCTQNLTTKFYSLILSLCTDAIGRSAPGTQRGHAVAGAAAKVRAAEMIHSYLLSVKRKRTNPCERPKCA